MNTITQDISFLITLLTLVLVILSASTIVFFKRRGRKLPAIRPISAYEAIPAYVGISVESSRPIHMSFGSAGLGDSLTALTIASAEFFYQISKRATISDVSPMITLSNVTALPLAQDTLRRAYQYRGQVDQFSYTGARWYPSGSRSLTFAAALTSVIGTSRVSSNFLAGSFGPEIALILEAGLRHDAPSIAMSDQLQGQAIAYAFSQEVLIGEEVFTAGAYLSDNPEQLGEVLAIDTLRWLLILVLVALFISRFLTTGA